MPSPTGSMATFPKRLQQIDPNLNCKFNRRDKKFNIYYQTKNRLIGNARIMVVEGDNGSFRHPDLRDIDIIMESDINRKEPKDREKEAAQHMVDEREKSRKDAKAMIRERTIDDKIQLINAFARIAGVGKGNSAFRRVQAKARRKVY